MAKPTASKPEKGTEPTVPAVAVEVEEQLRQRTAELEAALREEERITQSLRESEAQFRSIADNSLLGVSVIVDGKYVYTNPVQNEYFGYSADEMLSLDPLATVEARDRALAGETLRQALSSEIERAEITLRGQRKDGTLLDIELSGSATRVNGKRSLLLLMKDITARTAGERRLRESTETLRTVAASARDAILMINNDGQITFWNDAAHHIFGYSSSEAIGQDLHALLAAPPYRQSYREPFARFRKTGKGAAIGALRELRALRKDGTEFPIEISLSAVMLDEKWNAVGIVRDISERKLLERARLDHSDRIFAHAAALDGITAAERKFNNEPDALFRTITELVARATGVERASIWLFNEEETRIHCADLYESGAERHSAGTVMQQAAFAAEFQELKSATFVVADDAFADPRTGDYAEAYLKPLDIRALLHSAIEVSGKYLGVLCLERVHRTHHWEDDEISFASQVAARIGLALLARSQLQAQRAQHESERRLSSIFDSVELISVMLDREARLTYCNDYLLHLSGWQREEIIGRRWEEVFRPAETVDQLRAIFSSVLEDRPSAWHHQSQIVMRNGELRTVLWNNTILKSPDGDIIGAASVGQDITERDAAEKQLRLFRTLLDQSNDAIHVVDAETDRLIDVNERACTDSGYSREKMLTLSVIDLAGYDNPARISMVKERLQRDGFLVFETLQRRKDGSVFLAEMSLRLIVLDKPYIVSVSRDITERDAADKQLRLFRELINQSHDAIQVVDAQTQRLIDCNNKACTDLGYSREELMSLSISDIDAYGDPARMIEIEQRLEQDGFVMIDSLHRRKDRSVFPVELSLRRIVLDKTYVVSVARDITERKHAEEELQALQHLLREQAIRDPLTGLYNRRYLEEAMTRELLLAERKGYCVSAIMGDLDHFKLVNDRYGHRAGDEVLRTFGRLLKTVSRGSDIDCRYGGEEFLLLLPDMNEHSARARAESLRAALESTRVQFEGVSINVTGSFGVACFPKHARTGDDLTAAADKALYAAKEAGRNRVVSVSDVDAGNTTSQVSRPTDPDRIGDERAEPGS